MSLVNDILQQVPQRDSQDSLQSLRNPMSFSSSSSFTSKKNWLYFILFLFLSGVLLWQVRQLNIWQAEPNATPVIAAPVQVELKPTNSLPTVSLTPQQRPVPILSPTIQYQAPPLVTPPVIPTESKSLSVQQKLPTPGQVSIDSIPSSSTETAEEKPAAIAQIEQSSDPHQDALSTAASLISQGQTQSAIEVLQQAIQQNGSDAESVIMLSKLYLQLQQPLNAIELIGTTENPELIGLKAMAFEKAGQPDEAFGIYSSLQQQNALPLSLKLRYAALLENNQRSDEALQQYRQFLKHPDSRNYSIRVQQFARQRLIFLQSQR